MAMNDKYIDDTTHHKPVILIHPQTMDVNDFINNRAAINYLLSDFENIKSENHKLREKLNNDLTEIKRAQKEILPLLPTHEKLWIRYFHGSMQSVFGSIMLSILIGIIVCMSRYSINDLWSILGDFFKSLSAN